MDPHGDAIRQMMTSPDVMDILLRGDPREIASRGLVGTDADSRLTPEQIALLEELGYKEHGVPMTVTQIARAVAMGAISPETQIVRQR
jgi:hypothetical protein